MTKVVITPRAQAQLDRQMSYSIDTFGAPTATKIFARVETYLTDVIAVFPRSGLFIHELDIYERPVPRTPFVVMYRIEADSGVVRLLGFYHHAQDRADVGSGRNE